MYRGYSICFTPYKGRSTALKADCKLCDTLQLCASVGPQDFSSGQVCSCSVVELLGWVQCVLWKLGAEGCGACGSGAGVEPARHPGVQDQSSLDTQTS